MATFADNSVANFFFSLAMATKMVAAWSAVILQIFFATPAVLKIRVYSWE